MQSGLARRLSRMRRAAGCSVITLATAALAGCMAQQHAAPPGSGAHTANNPPAVTAQPRSSAQANGSAGGSSAGATTQPAAPPPPHATGTDAETSDDGSEGIVLPGEHTPLPLRFSASAEYLYGPVSGNLQVPVGGKKGTSTGNQPHLGNIGINDTNSFDGEVAVGWTPQDEAYIGGQVIHLSGGDTVPKGFVTHGVHVPKNTPVESDVRLDWYRFGLRHEFDLSTAPNGVADVTLTTWLEGLVWDFGYHLNAGKAGTAGRSFNEFGVQFGGTLAWRPYGGPFSIEAFAGSFPQINNMAQISIEGIRGRYHFYQFRRADFSVLLGVEWEQQRFKDSQKPLNNNIRVDFGPMLDVGLKVDF